MRKSIFGYIKKILAVAMCAVVSLGVVACDGEKAKGPNDIKVWAAYSTEKILRDKDYTNRYSATTLEVSAFRNENEAVQLIISPKYDVKYTFELSDLKASDGTILPKESFSAFIQHYAYVDTVKDQNSLTQTGWYPEALIPYDNAVAHGENIALGRPESDKVGNYYYNNGIYINLKPDYNQPAGLYTGNFKLTLDGKAQNIPVKAQVFDYTLSDEVHSGTSFTTSWATVNQVEMESNKEIYESYSEFMLDHRISLSAWDGGNHKIWNNSLAEGGNLRHFIDTTVKYLKDPRCSIIQLPYMTANVLYYPLTSDATAIDYSKTYGLEIFSEKDTKVMLNELIKVSLEEGVNIPAKSYTYYTYFDEASVKRDKIVKAQYTLSVASSMYHDVALKYAVETIVSRVEEEKNIIPADATSYNKDRVEYALGYFFNTRQVELLTDLYLRVANDPGLVDSRNNEWERFLFGQFLIDLETPASTSQANDSVRQNRMEMYRKANYSNGYKDAEGKYAFVSAEVADEYDIIMDKLFSTETGLTEFEVEVINSTKNIYDLSVGEYHKDLDLKCVFVSTSNHYHTATEREFLSELPHVWYPEGDVKCWAYGAVAPRTPYPNYHTDSEHLPARLYRWMMYNYDIYADLYWAIFSWGIRSVGYTTQHYYKTIFCVDDSSGAVGEGILLFPGVNYDVTWRGSKDKDGNYKFAEERRSPVASIRLKALQDGLEDYDLFYALEEFSKEKAATLGNEYDHEQFLNLVSSLGSQLYTGMKVNVPKTYQDPSYLVNFDATRKNLAGLLELANSKNVTVDKFEMGLGELKVTMSAPENVALEINGTDFDSVVTNGDFKVYTKTIDFDKSSNYITIKADGVQYFNHLLSGKVDSENITERTDLSKFSTKLTNTIDSAFADPVLVEDSNGNYYEFKIQSVNRANPRLDVNLSAYNIKKTDSKLSIEIYFDYYGSVANPKDIIPITLRDTSGNTGNEITSNVKRGEWVRMELDLTIRTLSKNVTKVRFIPQTEDPIIFRVRNIAVAR